MAKFDPEREAHKSWLGLLQPVGLVVSPPALIKVQAVLDKHVVPLQEALHGCVAASPSDDDPVLGDFPRFARDVLDWHLEDLAGAPGGPDLDPALTVALPDYHDALRPTYAVLDGMAPVASPSAAAGKVLMLVQVVDRGTDLDALPPGAAGWNASPQARLERLLRDTSVPAGLLLNGKELRLVYAPRGESSGHIGFPVAEMCAVGGRQILAAMHMLLSEHRVFGAPNASA